MAANKTGKKKLGVGKIDPKVSYRVLEEQEKYIRNLLREKKRKGENSTPSEVMRYLLDLGIKTHLEGRREKYEMSHYFRAELRTFTENFFKENNENYISRLIEINRYARFVTLLLLECVRMLYTIYWMMRDQSPFEDTDSNEFKIAYFTKMDNTGREKSDEAIKAIQNELGGDGNELQARLSLDKGIVFEEPTPTHEV